MIMCSGWLGGIYDCNDPVASLKYKGAMTDNERRVE